MEELNSVNLPEQELVKNSRVYIRLEGWPAAFTLTTFSIVALYAIHVFGNQEIH